MTLYVCRTPCGLVCLLQRDALTLKRLSGDKCPACKAHTHTNIHTRMCTQYRVQAHAFHTLLIALYTHTDAQKNTQKTQRGQKWHLHFICLTTGLLGSSQCWERERETKTEKTNVTINMILTFKADHLKRVSCNFNRFFQIKNLLMFLMNNWMTHCWGNFNALKTKCLHVYKCIIRYIFLFFVYSIYI